MWTNYHCHTHYCDGKNTIAEMIAAAPGHQLVSIGLSSHAPLPFASPWCMKPDLLPNYLDDVHAAQRIFSGIEIYKGLEVDFIPHHIGPADFRSKLDYTIGSIHFVDQLPDGRHWEIDGSHTLFLDGYENIFQKDIRAVVRRYFELTRQMMNQSTPDVVGHLDKLKIQNIDEQFFKESDDWYQQEVVDTLHVIKEAGSIVEVNTRGIYQKKSPTPYPSPWILEKILALEIPITLSSDAHHQEDQVNEFSSTTITLLKLGFKKIRILSDGKWRDVALNDYGI